MIASAGRGGGTGAFSAVEGGFPYIFIRNTFIEVGPINGSRQLRRHHSDDCETSLVRSEGRHRSLAQECLSALA